MSIKNIILSAIFKNAWLKAKAAAAKHGGRPVQYFASCLKICWDLIHGKPAKTAKAPDLRSVSYHDYAGQDIIGFFMSEKLHGVWARWDGKNFYTRNGNLINAPESFKRGLPAKAMLTGELYAGIGNFQKLCSIIRSDSSDWQAVSFNLFHTTAHKLPAYVQVIRQIKIVSTEQKNLFLAAVIAKGGEGVCLTDGNVIYKDKPKKSIEAVCAGVNPGKKGLSGKIGSLVCRLGDVVFNVSSGMTGNDWLKSAADYLGKKSLWNL